MQVCLRNYYVTFMARQVRWSAIIFWTTLDKCFRSVGPYSWLMSDTSLVSTNANFGSSKMAGKAWVQQVLFIFYTAGVFPFSFLSLVGYPWWVKLLCLKGRWTLHRGCSTCRGLWHRLPGGVNPLCMPCLGGLADRGSRCLSCGCLPYPWGIRCGPHTDRVGDPGPTGYCW